MNYSPFENEFESLSLTDIDLLLKNQIGEGWHIEYKMDIPKSKEGNPDKLKISKSIAAFANTKGGFVIWGIKCSKNNIPEEITGIDISSYKNFDDQISQIINSNITPTPYYEFKLVAISEDKYVFVIKVEESPTPPYINSQGSIYQREHNENKPIRERYIIEKLQEKSKDYYKKIERFCEMDLGETKGQSDWNLSALELYLFPLPYDGFKFENFHTSDFFKSVPSSFYGKTTLTIEDQKAYLDLGFNSFYSSEDSYLIRDLHEKNLIYKTTTVEIFKNGNLKFWFPMSEFKIDNIPKNFKGSEIMEYLEEKYYPSEIIKEPLYNSGLGIPNDDQYIDVSRKRDTDFSNHVKMIDGFYIIISIFLIITQYRDLLKSNKFKMEDPIGFRIRIDECWRKFVIFDNADYLDKIKTYNIPLSPKNSLEIPEFVNGDYYTIDISDDYSFFTIAKFILEGIGLPDASSIKYFEILKDGITKMKVE